MSNVSLYFKLRVPVRVFLVRMEERAKRCTKRMTIFASAQKPSLENTVNSDVSKINVSFN